jgi:hypothetical protein
LTSLIIVVMMEALDALHVTSGPPLALYCTMYIGTLIS